MIRDRLDEYEALRTQVATLSIVPRAAVTLIRHGLAAWLNMVAPSDRAPPSVTRGLDHGAPEVIASIFFRLVRGAAYV